MYERAEGIYCDAEHVAAQKNEDGQNHPYKGDTDHKTCKRIDDHRNDRCCKSESKKPAVTQYVA